MEKKRYKKGHFIGIGIPLGMPLAIPLGLALDNITLGIALGPALGVAIGSVLESIYNPTPLEEEPAGRGGGKAVLLILLGLGVLAGGGLLAFYLAR